MIWLQNLLMNLTMMFDVFNNIFSLNNWKKIFDRCRFNSPLITDHFEQLFYRQAALSFHSVYQYSNSKNPLLISCRSDTN